MLNKILRSKEITIVASVLIAIILWAYVITEENPTITQKFENIPVQILNEETLTARELVIVKDETPTVTITVEGKRTELTKISPEDIVATVDVYGYSYGENNIPVAIDVPSGLDVVEVKSSRITVVIDALVSEAFPVKICADEKVDGRELIATDIQPEEVMVTGARSIVDQIAEVRGVVKTGDLTSHATDKNVKLKAIGKDGEQIQTVKISAAKASCSVRMLETKEVELSAQLVGDVGGRYSISNVQIPDKITIKGDHDALERIDSLQAADIDVSGVTSTCKLPLDVKLPEGVFLADSSSDLFAYIVINNVAAQDVTVPGSDVIISDVGDGLIAHVDTSYITVSFKGSEALVAASTAEDALLSVNLSGLGEGVHMVDLKVDYTKSYRSVTAEPQQVQVTITSAQ